MIVELKDILLGIGLIAFIVFLFWGIKKSGDEWYAEGCPEDEDMETGKIYESDPIINSPTYSNVPGNIHHNRH